MQLIALDTAGRPGVLQVVATRRHERNTVRRVCCSGIDSLCTDLIKRLRNRKAFGQRYHAFNVDTLLAKISWLASRVLMIR